MARRKTALIAIPSLFLGFVIWWLFLGGATPSLADGSGAPAGPLAGKRAASLAGPGAGARGGHRSLDPGAQRQALVDLDAEYEAALSGFTGRLVDERGRPLAGRMVRFYRLDAEIIQNPGLFAAGDAVMEPQLETHETESDELGGFEVTGAWPHSFYILEADAEGDSRLTRPIERLPGPGEIVDLGDIVLKQLGAIVGRVVDRSNRGVAGVDVRAMDIPSSILELGAIERFQPEGVVIIRYGDQPTLVELPGYVKRYYDMLVRPRAVTMADGHFRLAAVQPGENVVAFRKSGLVPRTRKGVKVKPAVERDVGDIKMSEGEEAFVKVLETDKDPVRGAEVVIGATTVLFPVDFGVRVGTTDAKGEVYQEGFPAGKVTVAARRSKNHPWVVMAPENVAADIVITLPSRHHFDLTIKSSTGEKILKPSFKLMHSVEEGPPLDAAAMGFISWLDVKDRVTRQEDGTYRIEDLIAGRYTLAVCSKGHGASKLEFKMTADSRGEITLYPESRFTVQVLNHEDAPVRRARVFMQPPRSEGQGRLLEMPIVVGETDEDGLLEIRESHAGQVRLSASHPAYGYSHAQVELPAAEPVVIRMKMPGELVGRLTEAGRAPTPGKWSLMLEPRGRSGVRGAMFDMPKITVPNLDGDFRSSGLRPGAYRIRVIRSVKALGSPGGLIGFMMREQFMNQTVTKDVTIASGQVLRVELDAIKAPRQVEGPSGRVSGVVLINGRPGAGMMVTASRRGKSRNGVTVDEGGRFDLGLLEVGKWSVTLRGKPDLVDVRMSSHFWKRSVEIKDGEAVSLDISVSTGRVSGFVVPSGGAPVGGIKVKAVCTGAKSAPTSAAAVLTDQQGRFAFASLPAGSYRVSVEDDRRGIGSVDGVSVSAGGLVGGVSISLTGVRTISGVLDLSVLGEEGVSWAYLSLTDQSQGIQKGVTTRRDGASRTFKVRGLPPGTYKARVYVQGRGRSNNSLEVLRPVVVSDRDQKGLRLVVVEAAPKSSAKKRGGASSGKD